MNPQEINPESNTLQTRTKRELAATISKVMSLTLAILMAFPANVMAFSFNFSSFSFSGFKLNFNLFGTPTTSAVVAPETCDIQRQDSDAVEQCVSLFADTTRANQSQKELCEEVCEQALQDRAPSRCEDIGVNANVPVPQLQDGTATDVFVQGGDAVHASSGFDVSSDIADGSNYDDVCQIVAAPSIPSEMVSDTYAVNQVQQYQVAHTMLEYQRANGATLFSTHEAPSRAGLQSAEIDTCEEYVYKKFWELSVWEDSIAPYGDDYVSIWKVAYGQEPGVDRGSIGIRTEESAGCDNVAQTTTTPRSASRFGVFSRLAASNNRIGNRVDAARLKDSVCEPSVAAEKDPFASRSLTLRPKNVFFKTVLADNAEVFPGLTGVVIEDDGLRERLTSVLPAGRRYLADGWGYHEAVGQALSSEDPEQMAALYSLRQEYNELIAARNSIVDSLRSSCNVLTETLDADGTNSTLMSNARHLDVSHSEGLNVDYFEDAECFDALQGYFEYVNSSDASAFTVTQGTTSHDEALRSGCGDEIADALAATLETQTYRYMGSMRTLKSTTVNEFTKFQVVDPNNNAEYGSLVECMEDPSGSFFQSKLALEAIDRVLESTLATAESFGCFDLNQDGTTRFDVCDWSHKDFVDDVKRSYTSEREDAFKGCQALLDEGSSHFRNDDIIAWTNPETPRAVEAYLSELRRNKLSVGTVVSQLQADGLMDERGNFAGGGIAHGRDRQENGTTDEDVPMFGADFSYRLGYGTRVLDHVLLDKIVAEHQYLKNEVTDSTELSLFILVPRDKNIDYSALNDGGSPDERGVSPSEILREHAAAEAVQSDTNLRPTFKMADGETALGACLSKNLYAVPQAKINDAVRNFYLRQDNRHVMSKVNADDHRLATVENVDQIEWVMNKNVSVAQLNRYAVPPLDCVMTLAAEGSAYGNVNLQLFGEKVHPIMDVYAGSGVGIEGEILDWTGYLGVDIRVLSPDEEGNWDLNSVYTAGSIPPRPNEYNDENATVLQGVIDNLSEKHATGTTFTRTDVADWNKRQTVLKSTSVFYLSFIPMTVEAGISGGMGLALNPILGDVTSQLVDGTASGERSFVEVRGGVVVKPWVDFNAYASAAAGVPGFRAGVRADLTVLSFGVPATLDAGVKLSADYDGDDTLKNFELTYDVRTAASVEAEALSGRLSLFAEALMATYSTDLARWPGVQYRAPIWSLETGDRPVGEDVLRVVSYLKD